MTFLPIVERELRIAARRRSTYISRMTMVIVALAFTGWIGMASYRAPTPELGKVLFATLAGLFYFFAATAGVWATADCLSEEKREGTLGLLFLTDLKGYDVVLGKLAATSLNSFYGLLAIFPILAIPLLMGGVTAGEFWRVVLVALNLLFFSLTAGIIISAISRDDRKAGTGTLLLILFVLAATPCLGAYIASKGNASGYPMGFLLPSPAYACFSAFEPFFSPSKNDFWITTAVTQLYGWIFLLLACAVSPRTWQDRPAGAKLSRWRESWRRVTQGSSEARRALRGKLLNINPFLWLAGRGRVKYLAVWIFLAICAGLWLWISVGTDEQWMMRWWEKSMNVVLTLVTHLGLKVWLASESCRRLSQDRRSGALELLLSTPISVDEILRGQRLALLRQFGGPVAAALAADLVFMMAGVAHFHGEELGMAFCFYLIAMIFLIADLLSLSWVGMWLGLASRKPNRAAGGAVARIIILPGAVFFVGTTCFAFLGFIFMAGRFGNSLNGPVTILVLWSLLCGVNNLIWTLKARGSIRRDFRSIATQRAEVAPGIYAKSKKVPPVLAPR